MSLATIKMIACFHYKEYHYERRTIVYSGRLLKTMTN